MTAAQPRGIRSLPETTWIGLEEALSWVCFDEAFNLERLDETSPDIGMPEDDAKDEYQQAWRALADFSLRHGFLLRGYRRGRETDSQSRELSRDDLFNCKYIDFTQTPRGRTILLSRFDRDEPGIWQSIHVPGGSDFAHVIIRRDDLLDFKGRANARLVNRKASVLKIQAARELGRSLIQEKNPNEVRRDEIIFAMRECGISREAAETLWKKITEDRPELRRGGRRKRAG